MPERTYEVKTVGVDYECDACHAGTMQQTGIMLPSDPPWWRHKCSNCGLVEDLRQKYPTVRWERVLTA